MRRRLLIVSLALLLGACTSTTSPTTTLDIIPAPPPPDGPNPSIALPPVAVPREGPFTPPIQGYFPDGTDFIIKLQANEAEMVTRITASILYETDDGAVWDVGDVRFLPGTTAPTPIYADGVMHLQTTNAWHVAIEFDPDFLEILASGAEEIITTGITNGLSNSGYPILHLAPPFRWSTQYDPHAPMEVRFESFKVTLGCDEPDVEVIACLPNQTMQVKDLTGGRATPELTIESFIGRPISDPSYLDPGPLAADQTRVGPDVIWTGDEMIIWGGESSGSRWHPDGAAYDPSTDTWRVLADNPEMPSASPTRAVWVEDKMLVLSNEGTWAYDPQDDSWSSVGPDFLPPQHGPVLAIGDVAYILDSGLLFAFDVSQGEYEEIPSPRPGLGGAEWETYLFTYLGDLMISRLDGDVCDGRSFWRWDGGDWSSLPETSLDTPTYNDCSLASQVAVVNDDILIWNSDEHLTKIFRNGAWFEVPPLPEGSGEVGLVLGQRVLIPNGTTGSLFDFESLTWTVEPMPGREPVHLIWTGDEVLAWNATRGGDAWRWTPPE